MEAESAAILRMGELEGLAVQHHHAIATSIERVVLDRQARGGKMEPHLMRAPLLRPGPNYRQAAFRSGQDLNPGLRLPAVL